MACWLGTDSLRERCQMHMHDRRADVVASTMDFYRPSPEFAAWAVARLILICNTTDILAVMLVRQVLDR
jgi:hypothetical protein